MIAELIKADYTIQLEHDEEEYGWDHKSHGYVELSCGNTVMRCEDLQHNKRYHEREARSKELAQKFVQAVGAKSLAQKKVENNVEASTTVNATVK